MNNKNADASRKIEVERNKFFIYIIEILVENKDVSKKNLNQIIKK